MTTKEQVIQAAKLAGLEVQEFPDLNQIINHLCNQAYKAGEKAMQERAAKVCDDVSERGSNHAYMLAKAIRALEVEDKTP